jgi:class 3 adenylate cyclase
MLRGERIMPDHPVDRTILAVDIEGFGRQARTNPTRLRLRRQLDRWCTALLKQTQASPSQWCVQDTGDGFIFSVDPHIPRNVLLGRFVAGLAQRLVRYNRERPEAERMRLRLAMHAGDVLRDPEPIHGEATVLACRLLDAAALRACLEATEQPLAAIVSQMIYDNIVRQAYRPIIPATWHPVVASTKEDPRPAWVHVPGDVEAPRRAGVVVDRRSSA